MKIIFAVSLSLIAMIQAQIFVDLHNPEPLFNLATDYQDKVTELQEDIVETITGLRLQLSAILKRSSNMTLQQVQDNIYEIFDLDAPVRDLIFVVNSRNTDCMLNLRNQLNMHTEFSGYSSSNCLTRYNRNVDNKLNEAYGTLASYEELISVVQLLVVKSFNSINIWTHPEEIMTKIQTEYNETKTRWDGRKAGINDFLSNLESNIRGFNNVLGSCFTEVQQGLHNHYSYITGAVVACNEFDNVN
ncbi:hypothetical protein PVAND_007095 [Polypedilum vanderplanki]|uniref:Uncharacterized protein n=1 Tax=Polypedilum vanderplanki TaxID=319348 RepID=A0A9J6C5R5_POLVA|nr:hypothetical protein PVAND_007095 [Polypedilum vanderplanki]